MKTSLCLAIYLLLLSVAWAGEYAAYTLPRTQVVPITDTASGHAYELYIKLPQDYAQQTDTRYPVIYFTDAVWHIESLSSASEYLLENVVLVGISWQKNSDEALVSQYGPHVSRFRDYSFWAKANPEHPKLTFGHADKHLAFLQRQVIPFIENNYRVTTDDRTYFGYSLGGLFGAYALLTTPELFSHYILGSPSVELLLEQAKNARFENATGPRHVFVSYGSEETRRIDPVTQFVTHLQHNEALEFNIHQAVIDGSHQSAFPATTLASVAWLKALLTEQPTELPTTP